MDHPKVNESKVTVLDGGFSSQLSKYVGTRMDGDPLWTARFLHTNPDEVFKTHLDYLRAGADCISTNTYQASIGGYMKYLNLSSEESFALITQAVELAKSACEVYVKESKSQTVPLIAGSVGPYGAHLHDGSEYNGRYADNTSSETICDWHIPRIRTLVNAGVDLLALETIPCAKEAETLVRLLREFPNTKAWVSFSCKDGRHIAHGEEFQTVAKECLRLNPDQLVAIGVNCCNPVYITDLFRGFYNNYVGNTPLITYPNSGEKYTEEKGWVADGDCKSIDMYVENWLDLGVRYVGGCCRTTADDVSRIRDAADRWMKRM